MINFYLNWTIVKYYPLIVEIYPNKKYIINLLISGSSHLAQPQKAMVKYIKVMVAPNDYSH